MFESAKDNPQHKIADYVNSLTKPKPKRMVCVACGRSKRDFPETTYTEIPRGPKAATYENIKTDYLRQQYFRAKFRRQLFLDKLEVKDKTKTGYLLCDRHPFIDYTCNIPWVDITGKEDIMPVTIPAPVNKYARDVLSARKREEMLKSTPNTPMQKSITERKI